eukprot:2983329-Pleurochrysis_carterae.AAC.1
MPCGTRTHSLPRHRLWRHRAPPPFASSRQISTVDSTARPRSAGSACALSRVLREARLLCK